MNDLYLELQSAKVTKGVNVAKTIILGQEQILRVRGIRLNKMSFKLNFLLIISDRHFTQKRIYL